VTATNGEQNQSRATANSPSASSADEPDVKALVEDLCGLSPEFATMWRDNDVRTYGEGTKHLRHPAAGLIALEYSAFAVDGRPDLIPLPHQSELGRYRNDSWRFVPMGASIQAAMEAVSAW